MKIEAKRRATKEDKERAKNNKNGPQPQGDRADTWTDHRTPIYNSDGYEIGRIDQRTGYENERGR